MERTVKECDRCGKEVGAGKGPFWVLTISWHHPATLLLCKTCEVDFRNWLHRVKSPGYTAF